MNIQLFICFGGDPTYLVACILVCYCGCRKWLDDVEQWSWISALDQTTIMSNIDCLIIAAGNTFTLHGDCVISNVDVPFSFLRGLLCVFPVCLHVSTEVCVICTDSIHLSIQPKKKCKPGLEWAWGQIYTEEIWMITHHESSLWLRMENHTGQ